MFKAISISNMTAGSVAVMVGLTSSVMIVFQAAASAGATPAQVSSWLLALYMGMAVTSIGLSLFYRMPILTAWSTPGAALLVTSLSGVSMPEAIGAFIFSALLIILFGVTGLFKKLMNHVPHSIATGMLSGILLSFGTNIFVAMKDQFFMVAAMLIAYLIGKRFFPRFVILSVFILGIVIAKINGLCHLDNFHLSISYPVFTTPVFSLATIMSVGIPLFIVTMTAQNIGGITVMHAADFRPPISPVISWIGITNLLIAPFGGYAINLAVITSAICLSSDADPDPKLRYKSAVYAGIFYIFAGLFGATIVALFSGLPKELILAIAGMALISTMGSSFQSAVKDETERDPAIITLLVTASGISIFGIASAFWGLVAGTISLVILKAYKGKKLFSIKKYFQNNNIVFHDKG